MTTHADGSTIATATMTTARNAPCPCGSGKKYKRCHGAEESVLDGRQLGSPKARARAFMTKIGRKPGCYNDPDFLALEKEDPSVLEEYARFVCERSVSDYDRDRIRRAVGATVKTVVSSLTETEATGRCADVSSAIITMLEAQGTWCFGVKGSVRFSFARELGLGDRFFWVRDKPDFPGAFLGHAWVVAPPVMIVDGTARFQHWPDGQARHIPSPIYTEDAPAVEPDPRLFAAVPPPRTMSWHPSLLDLWSWCPPRRVREGGVTVWYQPDGISLPEATLDKIDNITIGGRKPSAFFEEVLNPVLVGLP